MISSTDTEWKASKVPGVSVKRLRYDPESQASTALVRLDAGARFPAHDHPAGEEVFVIEGDVVKPESVLCIIEAMKVMNEIRAERAGKVVQILVENGEAVEYGQPLFLIQRA